MAAASAMSCPLAGGMTVWLQLKLSHLQTSCLLLLGHGRWCLAAVLSDALCMLCFATAAGKEHGADRVDVASRGVAAQR